jgi:hypothetical protein
VASDAQLGETVRFVEGDLFAADVSGATVVTLALSPSVTAKVASMLRTQLRPGTRVVSRRDPVGSWTPDKVMKASDGSELFLYVVREK